MDTRCPPGWFRVVERFLRGGQVGFADAAMGVGEDRRLVVLSCGTPRRRRRRRRTTTIHPPPRRRRRRGRRGDGPPGRRVRKERVVQKKFRAAQWFQDVL